MIEEVTDFQFCTTIAGGASQDELDAAAAAVEASYAGWIAPIYGCTGPDHCNYDPEATMDDGSCIYAAEGFDCAGNCLSGSLVTVGGGSYPGEKSWDITDCDGNVLASGGSPFEGCVELGDNYSLNLQET